MSCALRSLFSFLPIGCIRYIGRVQFSPTAFVFCGAMQLVCFTIALRTLLIVNRNGGRMSALCKWRTKDDETAATIRRWRSVQLTESGANIRSEIDCMTLKSESDSLSFDWKDTMNRSEQNRWFFREFIINWLRISIYPVASDKHCWVTARVCQTVCRYKSLVHAAHILLYSLGRTYLTAHQAVENHHSLAEDTCRTLMEYSICYLNKAQSARTLSFR